VTYKACQLVIFSLWPLNTVNPPLDFKKSLVGQYQNNTGSKKEPAFPEGVEN
jgi:hypothetical protein